MLDKSYSDVKQILPLFDYSYSMSLLSDRIRRLQAETGWTNAELARKAGTSRAAPTDWLKDAVTNLSSAVAANISNQSNFCATWLATGEGPIYKTQAPLADSWPFLAFSRQQFEQLPERYKGRAEEAVLVVLREWEQSKSAGAA